jgi:hypothetical protein
MPHILVPLSDDLAVRLTQEAQQLHLSPEERIVALLEGAVAPAYNLDPNAFVHGLAQLRTFIQQIPAITHVATSSPTEPYWWVKCSIALHHKRAWQVIQELGSVLNTLSLTERLPTVFKPVSPPPYLNGGPDEFLSWVIEATIPFLDAGYIAALLEGRLPRPVGNDQNWQGDGENDKS